MPHIELRGHVNPAKIYHDFTPISERKEGMVYKIREIFLRGDENEVLIESIVVEEHLTQNFLLQVRLREEGLMIRLYASTPVQRTEGIKRFLAWLAKRLISLYPALTIGTTNLETEFLEG